MRTQLEELFYGNHAYFENIDNGEEYHKITANYAALSEELTKTLTEEQKKIFSDLCWADMGTEAEAVKAHYIAGFKLGFRIAVECLKD